jgi:hypothetical protein
MERRKRSADDEDEAERRCTPATVPVFSVTNLQTPAEQSVSNGRVIAWWHSGNIVEIVVPHLNTARTVPVGDTVAQVLLCPDTFGVAIACAGGLVCTLNTLDPASVPVPVPGLVAHGLAAVAFAPGCMYALMREDELASVWLLRHDMPPQQLWMRLVRDPQTQVLLTSALSAIVASEGVSFLPHVVGAASGTVPGIEPAPAFAHGSTVAVGARVFRFSETENEHRIVGADGSIVVPGADGRMLVFEPPTYTRCSLLTMPRGDQADDRVFCTPIDCLSGCAWPGELPDSLVMRDVAGSLVYLRKTERRRDSVA